MAMKIKRKQWERMVKLLGEQSDMLNKRIRIVSPHGPLLDLALRDFVLMTSFRSITDDLHGIGEWFYGPIKIELE